MIQSTSQEAYDKIVNDLGKRQYEVFNKLKVIEPACNKSIAIAMDKKRNQTVASKPNEFIKEMN